MKTQPPYIYSDAPNPNEPVAESAWYMYCPKADAVALLAKIREWAPNVILIDSTPGRAATIQRSSAPNPDDVRIWSIYGSITTTYPTKGFAGAPNEVHCPVGTILFVDEYAGELIDAADHPRDGIDQYPAVGTQYLGFSNEDGATAELGYSNVAPLVQA